MTGKEWCVEFYADVAGNEPVKDWLDKLPQERQAAAIAAIEEILATRGIDVCETEWGKHLGKGLYELRIRHPADEIRRMFSNQEEEDDPSSAGDQVLLRVYFTTDGEKVVLLLAGYDKGRYGSGRREDKAIEAARKRQADHRERRRRRRR